MAPFCPKGAHIAAAGEDALQVAELQEMGGYVDVLPLGPVPILLARVVYKRSVYRRSVAAAESDGTLGVAERYSSEDWYEHLQNFPMSEILKRVKSHLAFNAVFAMLIFVVNFFTDSVRPPPLALLSACSTALGLLLVFRTNAAYERWCAGYRCVRETKSHLQQLRRLARLWMTEEDQEWMDGQLATFPAYLGTFLGGGVGARGKSWALLSEMERDPREILVTFGEGLYKCLAKDASPAALYTEDRMQGHITAALASIEEMAQIVTVPVAREYSRHASRFLTVYLLILPFALVELGSFMPVAVLVIAWALIAIEEIGHTLEDPFNSPTQPLNVQAYLEQPLGYEPLMQAQRPFEVLEPKEPEKQDEPEPAKHTKPAEEDKGADGSGGEAAEADSSKEADPNEDAPAP
ncbi:unnamed protein product [Symbiodinium natans]|uniref:Uncharacterized protein n=1 Tax=Symbiodinium natans TaxID=878477 RepID=A0A812ILF5_9DINO|nr:unnamed protein product [Symbiodinium natans]